MTESKTEMTAVQMTVAELVGRRAFDPSVTSNIALWCVHNDSREDNGLDVLGTVEEIFQGLDFGPFTISGDHEDMWFFVQGSRDEMSEIEERFQLHVYGGVEIDKVDEGINSAIEYAETSIKSMIEKHGKIVVGDLLN